MSDEHIFLFASLGSKQPLTTRQVHIRRLYDLLQLCIQRHDYERAKRAWSILARCKEVEWKSLWPTALVIMSGNAASHETGQVADFLRTMMLQHPDEVKLLILRRLNVC
jgi:RNA polymerase I-specific transcription initiation factor RRN11